MIRLQRKVSLIIATDFLTWVPFITLAFLNYNKAVDGDSFYEFCSILLIPINSVLNPIIYNSDKILPRLRIWKSTVSGTISQVQTGATAVMTLNKINPINESKKEEAETDITPGKA